MSRATVVRTILSALVLWVLGLTEVFAAPVRYTSFDGKLFSLFPWYGKHIVLLTNSNTLNASAMQGLVRGLDAAYEVYHAITGKEPTPFGPTFLHGRSTIAEIPDGQTCGAGCAYLGFTGIEISSTSFKALYTGYVQRQQYDQVLFYELGRNFWLYHDQLAAFDPFVTGFAIANRFISLELAGLQGGPFEGIPFSIFKNSTVIDLLRGYLGGSGITWENSFSIGQAPPNPYGWGTADLAGAMFYRLFRDHGILGYRAFYEALATLPPLL